MTKRTTKIVADVCLYGNRETGAGWLAQLGDGAMLGDGEPKAGRSLTEAVWRACDAIRHAFGEYGRRPRPASIRVFEPTGQRMALADLNHPGYFGDLKWEAAVAYTIPVSEIVA